MRRAITFVSLVLIAGLLQVGGADAAPPDKFSPGDKGVGEPDLRTTKIRAAFKSVR